MRTRLPSYKYSSSAVSPCSRKRQQLPWAFVALSRDELHEWLLEEEVRDESPKKHDLLNQETPIECEP